jgi:Mrp family chromosome partitioning ATPase
VDALDDTRRRGELVNMYQIAEGILGGRGPRILQLMSATPGEGTSTVARELARTVAETIGHRVLLLKISLGTAGGGSCLDPILGGAIPFKVVVSRAAAGSYLTAEIGAVKQSVFNLFDAQCIDNLFQQILSLVDVVIVDAPSALTEFTGLVLARRVDGILLVVEAERTRAPIVNRARRLIEANGGRILGVVLNKQRQYIPRLFNRWG